MDELLYSRVEQLRSIRGRIEDALPYTLPGSSVERRLKELLLDIRDMIAAAEREHGEF